MFRTFVFAIAALIAFSATVPASAAVGLNGLALNGLPLNGRQLQSSKVKGVKANGRDQQEPTGGASLLAIELPTEIR